MACAGALRASAAEPSALPPGASADWLAGAQKSIAALERRVTRQPDGAGAQAWHAANREQNLRAWFTPDGVKLAPRDPRGPEASSTDVKDSSAVGRLSRADASLGADDSSALESRPTHDWQLELALRAWGRQGAMRAPASSRDEASANRIDFDRGGFEEWFVNDPNGLKQNFRIDQAPAGGSGALLVEYDLKTSLKPRLVGNGEGIEFSDAQDRRVLRYRDLVAQDAGGAPVAGRMELAAGADKGTWIIRLVLDDASAAYPVTVDPLFTGVADAVLETDQDGGQMGLSVGGAGDVNGDGYDDVIVGANLFDSGQTDEGAAFIFLGSASGIASGNPGSAATILQSNQASAFLGDAVAGAGDVNGDGYADVIVGANGYDNGFGDEGGAFIYLGSASGVASTGSVSLAAATAATAFVSLQGASQLGFSVAGAGDVNGDGYGDVIVGALTYDNPVLNEGAAFVLYGSSTGVPSGNPTSPGVTLLDLNQGNARFGCSVASAGDINADGYDDVIVGAEQYSNGESSEGCALVYLGSSTGITNSINELLEPNLAAAHLGFSVAGAGDVNGDGYADMVVGAPIYTNALGSEGAVVIFPGSGSVGSQAIGSPGVVVLESNLSSVQFGYSVAGAGDVNGDGYADIVAGARGYNGFSEGGAFVYLGSTSGITPTGTTQTLPQTANASLLPGQQNALAGYSVAGAGDVNGDGYADVLVGAPGYDDGNTDEGGAFVYLGAASGVASTGTTQLAEATAAATIEGNLGSAFMGSSVAYAGDVNGDGYADVIIGASNYANGQSGEGAAFLFLGSATGIASGDPTNASAVFESNVASAQFGFAVACAGDVNADGYDDIIISARTYADGQSNEGAAFIYLGSASGIAGTGTSLPAHQTANASLESNAAGAIFGQSVAGAGDINGDGYADVIVGSFMYPNVSGWTGAVFIYLGSASGVASTGTTNAAHLTANTTIENSGGGFSNFGKVVAGAGDVNRDGYADVIIGDSAYGLSSEGKAFIFHGSATGIASGTELAANTTLASAQASGQFGYNVAGAGDVNGDGHADVIVGAWQYDIGETNEGAAFVFHGSSTGVASGGPATANATLQSNQASATLGSWASAAGDVNGDGYGDVIVGANNYTNGQSFEGAAFLFNGSASGIVSAGTPANAAATLESNQAGASFGIAVARAGDVNGDGYSDVIVGSPNYNKGQSQEGAAFVFQGNRSKGKSLIPRQRRASDAAPISIGLQSDSGSSFRIAAWGKTVLGRERIKLEWEAKPLGTAFNGAGLQQSASWIDNGGGGTPLNESVTGLAGSTLYHWRARIRNQARIAPFTRTTRWMNQSSDGWQLADVRTGVAPTPTPSATPSASPTTAPSSTPSPSLSPTASASPTPSATASVTPTATACATATVASCGGGNWMIVGGSRATLVTAATNVGATITSIRNSSVFSFANASLVGIDVVIFTDEALGSGAWFNDASNRAKIANFVSAGGGLYVEYAGGVTAPTTLDYSWVPTSGVVSANVTTSASNSVSPAAPATSITQCLTDADLDNWNFSSQSDFTSIGGLGAVAINDNTGNPVMIAGTFGSGRVCYSNQVPSVSAFSVAAAQLELDNALRYVRACPPTPTPSPTASLTPSSTPSATASLTPTASQTASATASPTASPTASLTPSQTASATPSASATASPTASPTASLTPSQTASATPSASATASPTASSTVSLTPSPTSSVTLTASQSPTATTTPSPTASQSPTASASASPTASLTASASPTATQTPTLSSTPSLTASASLSPTASPTPSISPTLSPSSATTSTPSLTPSVSLTASSTSSPTPSLTLSPTPSVSPSVTDTPDITSTLTPTVTPSQSLTPSLTPSPTAFPTDSATPAPTETATPTPTASISPTESSTPTPTPTPPPPTFVLQPASQIVNAGQNVGFVVEASGAGPITYQWLKTDSALTSQTQPSLAIASAQTSDAGNYRCEATSPWGTTSSNVAALAVIDPPATNDAAFAGTTLPAQVPVGARLFVGVTLQNTSSLSWSAAQGYALAVQTDANGILAPNPGARLYLRDAQTVVPAGGVYQFIAEIQAPNTAGTYTATLRMVEEGVASFGETVQLSFEAITPPNSAADWEAYE